MQSARKMILERRENKLRLPQEKGRNMISFEGQMERRKKSVIFVYWDKGYWSFIEVKET